MAKVRISRGAACVLAAIIAMAPATVVHAGLLVAGEDGSSVGQIFSYGPTGASLGNFTSGGPALDGPSAARFGPDGNLYVLSGGDTVYRYNGQTGVNIDTFIATNNNGLEEAKDMLFGPDGNLYIAANCSNLCPVGVVGEGGRVMRFNGATGAYMGDFVANGAGAASGTGRLSEAMGMAFDRNGNLYVGNDASRLSGIYPSDNVLEFSSSGAFVGVFVPDNDHGLQDPNSLVFGADGNLYIAWEDIANPLPSSHLAGVVSRYNGSTGAFIDFFVPSGSHGLTEAQGLAFGPDGNLYVGSGDTGEVFRFNGQNGAFIDVFVAAGAGGLGDPKCLAFTLEKPIPVLGGWGMALLITALGLSAAYVLARRAG